MEHPSELVVTTQLGLFNAPQGETTNYNAISKDIF